MRHQALRNYFTKDCQYVKKGQIVEIPDGIEVTPSILRPLSDAPAVAAVEEPTTFAGMVAVKANLPGEEPPNAAMTIGGDGPVSFHDPSPTPATKELRPGEYLCSKCNATHRETSKVGKSHLKHKV